MLYTEKILHLSTAHLMQKTYNALEDISPYPIVFQGWEWGTIVRVTTDDIEDAEDLPDLVDCIRFAINNDCGYIRFDGDAPEVPDLPTYEWD